MFVPLFIPGAGFTRLFPSHQDQPGHQLKIGGVPGRFGCRGELEVGVAAGVQLLGLRAAVGLADVGDGSGQQLVVVAHIIT